MFKAIEFLINMNRGFTVNVGERVVVIGGGDVAMDAARTAILRMWSERISRGGAAPMDAKTAIQEWAQARGLPPPSYDTIGRDGPDHAPVFTVSARLDNGAEARASAPSKRAAQQAAAAKLLESLDPDDE